mmetsp:Transcript_11377/g.23252  ORF Transcript_11377/g.23252 Transcript_11377/m.23252 type:complete len:132 (+) Transcript_11377:261-656(+)
MPARVTLNPNSVTEVASSIIPILQAGRLEYSGLARSTGIPREYSLRAKTSNNQPKFEITGGGGSGGSGGSSKKTINQISGAGGTAAAAAAVSSGRPTRRSVMSGAASQRRHHGGGRSGVVRWEGGGRLARA